MNTVQQKQVDELYFSMYDDLISYALSSLGNNSLAEEAVQETFRIACSRPDSLLASPRPKGWLVTALRYVISNMEKRRFTANRIVTDCLGDKIDTIAACTDEISVDLLYGNVAGTEEFRLIKAIALEGKSLIELADEMHITVNACKKRAQRAREVLQRRIK